jgi:acyl carrier protein
MIPREKIREIVVRAICSSLALEPEQVRDESRLIEELGMDSLDFLDIMFSLEKEFQMKIRDAEFDRMLRPDKSDTFEQKEFLEPEEIAGLEDLIPELTTEARNRPIARREIFSFVTVETLLKMVEKKIRSASSSRQSEVLLKVPLF